MTTYFISDLHLCEQQPMITKILLNFLNAIAGKADALYILGDLFEVWIGDDQQSELITTVKKAFNSLKDSGVPIYLLTGNRDFLLGKRFAAESSCRLVKQPQRIDLYGTPTVILHGDSLCTADRAFQWYRRLVMNPVTKTLFLQLPYSLRQTIAKRLRKASTSHNQTLKPYLMDVTPSAVITQMEKYNVSLLIHGHTHKPAFHPLQIKNIPGERIVLGAWHTTGHALKVNNDGKKEFITLT